jgi:hypothetical protein
MSPSTIAAGPSRAVRARLDRLTASPEPRDWLLAARSKHCTTEALTELADRIQTQIRSAAQMEWSAAHILAAVLAHPACPPALLDQALAEVDSTGSSLAGALWNGALYAHTASRNPSLTRARIVSALDRLASIDFSQPYRRAHGEPRYARIRSSRLNAHGLSQTLLAHPNTPTDLLRAWLTPPAAWGSFRGGGPYGVAGNPHCPPDLQLELARHRLAKVRKALAENLNLADEAAAILVADTTASVRARIIRAGRADAALLAASVEHNSTWVRAAVAATTDDPETLTRLAMDRRQRIRRRAVANAAAPDEAHVAAALLGDANSW